MDRKYSRLMNHQHSRRIFIGGAAALGAGAAGLAATPGAMVRPANAQDSVEISMMGWGSPLEKENVDKGMQSFESQNPGITVDWQHVPVAADQQLALKTAIAGGTAPDVFWSTPYARLRRPWRKFGYHRQTESRPGARRA